MSDEHLGGDVTGGDVTRATAQLPGLHIEVEHRRVPEAEQILIHLQALPSFEAAGRVFEAVNPFAFWAEMTRLMWLPYLPWLGVAQALMPPAGMRDTAQTSPEA